MKIITFPPYDLIYFIADSLASDNSISIAKFNYYPP